MVMGKHSRWLLLASAAVAVMGTAVGCSDTSISSPGDGGGQTPPPPPPPPPPPATASIDLVSDAGCPDGTVEELLNDDELGACVIEGNLTADLTLTADNGYVLRGPVFVGEDGGTAATLTIEPGALIIGESAESTLIVARGSQIMADGEADNPIVMTSYADAIDGESTETSADVSDDRPDARGEWGGLILNGFAPINACSANVPGGSADCEKSGEGNSGEFGGDDPNDNSGILRYLRVQYAGRLITQQDELNGIAFQGVGDGTTVDYIQVHNNSDDGVEMFGGTVKLKHVLLTGNADDSFDWTDGWTGGAQYILIDQAEDAGDRGFEMDNFGDDNTATPLSDPLLSNITIVSNPDSATNTQGFLFKEGTGGDVYNTIIDGSPICIGVDGANTGELIFQSSFIDCPTLFGTPEAEDLFNAFPNNESGDSTLQSMYFPGPEEQGVTVSDPSAVDAFFDAVDYIGAFAPTETADNNWATGWSAFVFADDAVEPAGCPAGTTDTGNTVGGDAVCELPDVVEADTTLAAGNVYALPGPVFVGADSGADPAAPISGANPVDLTIEAGVTVYGVEADSAVIVTRGSRLFSNGTAAAPVVFTSAADVSDGDVDDGEGDARGEWGGLILNGRAPINACSANVPGGSVDCVKSGEGNSGEFGGATADDDSGNIFYTRVQYAGRLITQQDELNGIAFQGVGSGTNVDYIQVHNNSDDGVEMFGGTVQLKHVILTGNADDSFDWTDGWVGGAQYIIIEQDDLSGDRGFEMDNFGDDNTATPLSNPIIANTTILSNPASATNTQAFLFKEGTGGRVYNTVVAGSPICLAVDGANSGELAFDSSLLDCPTTFGTPEAETLFNAGQFNNEGANTLTGFSFLDGDYGLVPGSAEEAATASDPSALDPFFDNVDYIGAVADADDEWYLGWTLDPAN